MSLTIARESIVLVKNETDLLPLTKSMNKVAVIGPNANNLRNMFGGYSHPASNEEAVQNASQADIAIMVVGGKDGFGKPCTTGEGNDSSDIGLPGVQEELVKDVHATGTPVVFVHMSARPLSSPWIFENISAILEVWRAVMKAEAWICSLPRRAM